MKAKDILEEEETAVVIFTDGLNLVINDDGSGESGVWVVKKNLSVEKVIIYLKNKTENINKVYLGDFSHLESSEVKDLEHRFIIVFNNLELKGTTEETWNGFTNSNQGAVNPIRYIK